MEKVAQLPRAARRVPIDEHDAGTRGGAHSQRGQAAKLDLAHLWRLAEFRYRLRCFLHVSQAAAEETGLRNQQYQLLQCVGAMPEGVTPTIANVAARMLLKHNSAVELVDRSVEQGLLRRSGDADDHRRILLRITPHGKRILASLADFHTRELEQSGPELVRALNHLLRGRGTRQANSKRKAGAR